MFCPLNYRDIVFLVIGIPVTSTVSLFVSAIIADSFLFHNAFLPSISLCNAGTISTCQSVNFSGLWFHLAFPCSCFPVCRAHSHLPWVRQAGECSQYTPPGYCIVCGKTRNPCTLDFTTCRLVTNTPSLMLTCCNSISASGLPVAETFVLGDVARGRTLRQRHFDYHA